MADQTPPTLPTHHGAAPGRSGAGLLRLRLAALRQTEPGWWRLAKPSADDAAATRTASHRPRYPDRIRARGMAGERRSAGGAMERMGLPQNAALPWRDTGAGGGDEQFRDAPPAAPLEGRASR